MKDCEDCARRGKHEKWLEYEWPYRDNGGKLKPLPDKLLRNLCAAIEMRVCPNQIYIIAALQELADLRGIDIKDLFRENDE